MNGVRAFLHNWQAVLLIIHVGIAAAMIVVILLQRSEGGGLGMGGRTDALFSVRGQTNILSRLTGIFAGCFFFLSLLMAWSLSAHVQTTRSIMDQVPATQSAPAVPAVPSQPAAPTR